MCLRRTQNRCTVSDGRSLTKPTQPVRRLRRPIGLRPANPSRGRDSFHCALALWIAGDKEVSMPATLQQAENWRDSLSTSHSNGTDTLNPTRPLHRHSEQGVTAVLVQARKEAMADANLETLQSQVLTVRRIGPSRSYGRPGR
jgi:hypothetical protein